MIDRTPPGHENVPALSSGLRWGLSDSDFETWWNTAILKEDAEEFVHFHQGTRDGARFCCALDYFTAVDRRAITADLLVRAYLVAKNLPGEDATNIRVKYEAQAMYEEPSVVALLDRIRYRSRRSAEDRIAARTIARIEKLYDDADKQDDPEIALATNKAALDGSLRFLAAQAKDRSTDAVRRDKNAVAAAMAANVTRAKMADEPPTTEEARQHLVMLREVFGPTAFAEMVRGMLSPQLAAALTVDTIEAEADAS